MTIYECPRCHYTTEKLSSYKSHLKRILSCQAKYSNNSSTHILQMLDENINKDKKFTCTFCNCKFKSMSSRSHHYKVCDNKQKASQVVFLKDELDKTKIELENNNRVNINIQNNNITNNQFIQNNNIVILRDFGHENMTALPPELLSSLILDLEYRSLLENLHFDPDYPENHNIRLKSSKRRIIEIYKNNKWNPMPYVNALNDIILHANRIFQNHYRKKKSEIAEDVTEEELEEIERQLYQIQNGLNDNVVKPMLKEIELIIEQYRDGVPKKNEEKFTISRPCLDGTN